MTRIIQRLADVSGGYRALLVDLWGCLHDGVRAHPEAVAALRAFKAGGGAVVLITNSPRPSAGVERQLGALGVPRDCWDVLATSGDSAKTAMFRGVVGARVHHVGPDRDLGFFEPPDRSDVADPAPIRRVGVEDAEGLVVTGPWNDAEDRPEDYRNLLLLAKARELPLLCANPDVVVDQGDRRLLCAGAIAQEYGRMGGASLYFGKPHPPIYDLARRRLACVAEVADEELLAIGDGIATDIQGASGEGLDSVFVTGGLAALPTGTERGGDPDPERLAAFLEATFLTPTFAIGLLR